MPVAQSGQASGLQSTAAGALLLGLLATFGLPAALVRRSETPELGRQTGPLAVPADPAA